MSRHYPPKGVKSGTFNPKAQRPQYSTRTQRPQGPIKGQRSQRPIGDQRPPKSINTKQNRKHIKPKKAIITRPNPALTKIRQRKNSGRTEKFFALCALLVAVYIGGHFWTQASRPQISQMRIEVAALDAPAAFSGLIIRDEVVYHANDAGALFFHVDNHERVRRGALVASIQDAPIVQAHNAALFDIEQDAVLAQRDRGQMFANASEIAHVNQSIMRYVDNAAFDLAGGDISRVFGLANAVQNGISSRNNLYFADDVLEDMVITRDRLLADIAEATSTKHATLGGVISWHVDELAHEPSLSVDNVANIPREFILGGQVPATMRPAYAQPGDALFRIVRFGDMFIVALIPQHYVQGWQQGAFVTIFAQAEGGVHPLMAQIHTLRDNGLEYYVVLQTNSDSMRFIDARRINFRLEEIAQEGLKIPHEAIVERSRFVIPSEFTFILNNMRVVNLLVDDNITPVEVLGNFSASGSYFYAMRDGGQLRLGDVLTTTVDDENITHQIAEISTVTGIFVTTRGVTAAFRQINTDGHFGENSDFIILNPANNPGLSRFDQIAADAGAIYDRLLLH